MNKILFKQGTKSEYVYIIDSGELEFFKNILIEDNNENESF
jgi:CRP-like cAMP-binding protein